MDASISSIRRKLSTQRSPQVWKVVVSLDPLGVQLHPMLLVISVNLELVGRIFRAEGTSLLQRSQEQAHRALLSPRQVAEGVCLYYSSEVRCLESKRDVFSGDS